MERLAIGLHYVTGKRGYARDWMDLRGAQRSKWRNRAREIIDSREIERARRNGQSCLCGGKIRFSGHDEKGILWMYCESCMKTKKWDGQTKGAPVETTAGVERRDNGCRIV